MGTRVFKGKIAAEAGTAAGELTTKTQLDTAQAFAQDLGNATGTLAVAKVPTITTAKVSDFTTAVQSLLAAIVGAAPGTLDTLVEVATAIGNDPAFSTTINGLITAQGGRITTLEARPVGVTPISVAVPATAANTPVTFSTGLGRRIAGAKVIELSSNQEIDVLITNPTSGSVTLDFGASAVVASTYVLIGV